MNLRVPWSVGHFLTSWGTVSFSRRTLLRGVKLFLQPACSSFSLSLSEGSILLAIKSTFPQPGHASCDCSVLPTRLSRGRLPIRHENVLFVFGYAQLHDLNWSLYNTLCKICYASTHNRFVGEFSAWTSEHYVWDSVSFSLWTSSILQFENSK
jgi:hypothetical protein